MINNIILVNERKTITHFKKAVLENESCVSEPPLSLSSEENSDGIENKMDS